MYTDCEMARAKLKWITFLFAKRMCNCQFQLINNNEIRLGIRRRVNSFRYSISVLPQAHHFRAYDNRKKLVTGLGFDSFLQITLVVETLSL